MNKIFTWIITFFILFSCKTVYSQIAELDSLKLYHQIKGGIPKDKIYRLSIFCRDSIFPDTILLCKNLKELYIVGNADALTRQESSLNVLPDEICQLKNLISLKLPQNKLKSLPPCINSLDIQFLDLSSNYKISLNDVSNIKTLKYLILFNCLLDSIPESICNLTSLFHLDLTGNKLALLPVGISNLKNLKSLYLSNNPIQNFNSIFSIVSLESLNLSSCNLKSIPSGISKLKQLEQLDIRYNNLSTKEKRKLKKLLPKCKIMF